MAEIGCGAFGAAIVARESPSTILRDITPQVVAASCNRRLNSVSDAKLTIAQCPVGSEILPWKHALLLSWDADFLWFGPITRITDNADGSGDIEAKDIMEWMAHRKVRDNYSSIGAAVDVTTIFSTILAAGFAQDATVAYTLSATPTGITAEREVLATDHVYVADVLNELGVTGIDWTVVLQTIICGDVDISTTPIGVLNEAHFVEKPQLAIDGDEQANFVTVRGDGTFVGLTQDATSEATYGLLDLVEQESTILDQTSVNAAAATRLALRKNPPLTVGAMRLRSNAPLGLADIIPGAVVSVSIDGSFVSYAGSVRLETVEFTMTDGHWEAVLNGQPVGTTS